MNFDPSILEKDEKITPTQLLREERWEKGVNCTHCLSSNVNKNGMREDGIQQYRCEKCGKSFNDRTNTIFSKTQMTVGECLKIIKSYEQGKNTTEISNEIERSWLTVNNFIKRLNQSLISKKLLEMIKELEEEKIDYSRIGCGSSPEI